MIRGVHTMFYSSEAHAMREFLRDKLGFRATDVGDGWLIFDLPEADMGCHPSDDAIGVNSGTQAISFYCDDINKTVSELKKKHVEFTQPVADHGYGLVTFFKMPGNFDVQLYQPKYVKNSSKPKPAAKKPATKKAAKVKVPTMKKKPAPAKKAVKTKAKKKARR